MPWSPGSEQLLRSTCRVTEIIMESKCTWGRARLVSYCSSPHLQILTSTGASLTDILLI